MRKDQGVITDWRRLEACLKQRKDISGKAMYGNSNQVYGLVNNIVSTRTVQFGPYALVTEDVTIRRN